MLNTPPKTILKAMLEATDNTKYTAKDNSKDNAKDDTNWQKHILRSLQNST